MRQVTSLDHSYPKDLPQGLEGVASPVGDVRTGGISGSVACPAGNGQVLMLKSTLSFTSEAADLIISLLTSYLPQEVTHCKPCGRAGLEEHG